MLDPRRAGHVLLLIKTDYPTPGLDSNRHRSPSVLLSWPTLLTFALPFDFVHPPKIIRRICFEWLISGRLQARSSTKLEREKTFNYIMTAFQVPEKTEIPNFFGATHFLITRHGWKKVRISLMGAPGLAWPGLLHLFVCLFALKVRFSPA